MKEKTLENKLDYIPDPFVTLKDKLTILTEGAADHSTVQIPNLYITACPGSQIEEKIKNLVDFLEDKHLFPFVGEETIIEWEYVSDTQSLPELYSRIYEAAGFYGTFKGVIVLHFDPCVTVDSIRHLIRFAKSQQGTILFIFMVPNTFSTLERQNIKAYISSYLSIESIHVDIPSADEMIAFLKGKLQDYGLKINNDASASLFHDMNKLTSSDSFNGFDTLEKLANDLLWNALTSSSSSSNIDVKDIQSAISNHIITTKKEEKPQRYIGFTERN